MIFRAHSGLSRSSLDSLNGVAPCGLTSEFERPAAAAAPDAEEASAPSAPHSAVATISHGTMRRMMADCWIIDVPAEDSHFARETIFRLTPAASMSHCSILGSTMWLYAKRASRRTPAFRPYAPGPW